MATIRVAANQPPNRQYGPDTEIQHRPGSHTNLQNPAESLSKREADTEFDPHIADTDAIADAVFADAVSETSKEYSNFQKNQKGCGGLRGENAGAFPKAGLIFQQPFSLPETAQTLAEIAFRAAGKSVKKFPAASTFALRHPWPPRSGFGPFGPALRGHSRDTFWTLWSPGAGGPPRHSLGHLDFRGHSVGHSPGHFGPEGPEASCRGPGMSQHLPQNSSNKEFWTATAFLSFLTFSA